MKRDSGLFWYRWIPGDYLRVTRGWPPIARLVYRDLLDAQWDLGELPAGPERLHELVNGLTDDDWRTAWPIVEPHFPREGAGRQNFGLEVQRAEIQQMIEARRKGAEATNEKRWGKVFPFKAKGSSPW